MAASSGAIAPSRYSIFDRINQISTDDDEIFQVIEELESHVQESSGWRWHSESTQRSQDNIFATYESFLTGLRIIGDNLDQKEKELAMFPPGKDECFKRLKLYITFIAKFGRGRARNTSISYRGLVRHRIGLIFWHKRIHTKYGITTSPNHAQLFNAITEAMRYAVSKLGVTIGATIQYTKVGLPELRQLIDYDTLHSASIEVSEGHHLAWCIGRVCAVRPGSIGTTRQKTISGLPFLTWGDVQITRSGSPLKFQVAITFRNLKTNREDPEEGMRKPNQSRSLTCVVNSPSQVDNLIFSIPHRLLVIALRRGIIDGINTIDELVNGQSYNIMINREHLSKPIILGSKPRGLEVSEKAASAASLTDYLALRGLKIGCAESLTFTSIRRRAAGDLTRAVGRDAARVIMNHDPETRTLEKYYLSIDDQIDVSGISLGEPGDLGSEGYSRQMDEARTLAIYTLSSQKACEIHGPAVNALMVKLMASDPGYPYTATPSDLKNYKRRIRRVALRSLLDDEVQKQRREIGTEEFNNRVKRLTSSKIMDLVLQKAQSQLSIASENDEEISSEEESLFIDDDTQQIIHNQEENAEDDLETQSMGDNNSKIYRELDKDDEDDSPTDSDVEIDYATAACTFMQTLLDNTLSQHKDLKNNPIPCPLCQEDDTITDPTIKNKDWTIQVKLNDHMKTYFHTPRAKWIRRAELDFNASGKDVVTCPYYQQVGITKRFSSVKYLVKHIEGVTDPDHQHYAREDGWLSPNWASHPEMKSTSSRRTDEIQFRQKVAFMGLPYSDSQAVPSPVPHKSRMGIILAPGPSPKVPHYNTKFLTGNNMFKPPGPSRLTDYMASIIASTPQPPPWTTSVIPPHLRGVIVLKSPYAEDPVKSTGKKRQGEESIEAPATKRHQPEPKE